jgi:hypothetical protein
MRRCSQLPTRIARLETLDHGPEDPHAARCRIGDSRWQHRAGPACIALIDVVTYEDGQGESGGEGREEAKDEEPERGFGAGWEKLTEEDDGEGWGKETGETVSNPKDTWWDVLSMHEGAVSCKERIYIFKQVTGLENCLRFT